MAIKIGINLEFVRHHDLSFEAGVRKAAELGYKYVEPCVATGRDLLAVAGYYHMLSMEDDPLYYKELLDSLGLKCSGLSAHTALMRPEIGVNYLRQAIRWAADIGAPCVNTDEGPKPEWMSDEEAFQMIRYTLRLALETAERYGIPICLEQHQIYTTKPETFDRLMNLFDSPMLKINFDTGNLFLAGQDPIEWLRRWAPKVAHVHAKDIGGVLMEQRGKVTGTPVGVACGDGVIDWPAVIAILEGAGFDGVLSVECGTIEQAERSIRYLGNVLGRRAA